MGLRLGLESSIYDKQGRPSVTPSSSPILPPRPSFWPEIGSGAPFPVVGARVVASVSQETCHIASLVSLGTAD